MNNSKDTRRQRGLDFRANLGRHAHLFNLKDVCKEADLNYYSIANAINRLVSLNDTSAISDERLTQLEEGLKSLSKKIKDPVKSR